MLAAGRRCSNAGAQKQLADFGATGAFAAREAELNAACV